ncbi:MAG: hypothetical protein HQK51_11260 [Oligoflexia bacterium]|nr:hypothetical protein [Oligoflexia bacterium]
MIKIKYSYLIYFLILLMSNSYAGGFESNIEIEKMKTALKTDIDKWDTYSASSKEHGQNGSWWYHSNVKDLKANVEKNTLAWADRIKELAMKICGIASGVPDCSIEIVKNQKKNNTISFYPVLKKAEGKNELSTMALTISDIVITNETGNTCNNLYTGVSKIKCYKSFQQLTLEIPEIKNPFDPSNKLQDAVKEVSVRIPIGTSEKRILAAKLIPLDASTNVKSGEEYTSFSPSTGGPLMDSPSDIVSFDGNVCRSISYMEGIAQKLNQLGEPINKLCNVLLVREEDNYKSIIPGIIPISIESTADVGLVLYKISSDGKISVVQEDLETSSDPVPFSLKKNSNGYIGIDYDSSFTFTPKVERETNFLTKQKTQFGDSWPNIHKAYQFILSNYLNSINLSTNKIDKNFVEVFVNGDGSSIDPDIASIGAKRLKQIILSDWRALSDDELLKMLKKTFPKLEEFSISGTAFKNGTEEAEFQNLVKKIKEQFETTSAIKINYYKTN